MVKKGLCWLIARQKKKQLALNPFEFKLYHEYTQYPIIRNGDLRPLVEFLKNSQFPDADRFLILQGWALAVS